MGRGKALTDVQMAVIRELDVDGKPHREIAKRIGKSPTAVLNYLHRLKSGVRKKKAGRPPTVTPQLKRAIHRSIRSAQNERVTAGTLVAKYQPGVGVRRVQQLLSANHQLAWTRIRRAPRLSDDHKKARVEWSEKQLAKSPKWWRRTIFSDEKKWNLDGPDGNAYHWACKDIDPKYFSCRKQGGKSLMVWGCFSARGMPQLKIIEGTLNSDRYQQLIEDIMLPFAESAYKGEWRFQQDNASMHVSKSTREFFMDRVVFVMDWPSCSPDLNPIENLWGILVRQVYRDFRQFESLQDLREAIETAWDNIDPEVLKKLADSMTKRCIKVIKNKGAPSGY